MSASSHAHLIVFARVPRLGEVKTRLAASLGEAAALGIHRLLLEHTLATGSRCAQFEQRTLQIAGNDDHGECRRLVDRWGYRLSLQEGTDLGDRMARAIDSSIREGAPAAVLIGSDCPTLSVADLEAAIAETAAHDLVLAPAEDGGYALIACARPQLPVFKGVAWGTSTVLEQTIALARQAGLSVSRLRTVWDIDTEADWNRWQLEQASGGQ